MLCRLRIFFSAPMLAFAASALPGQTVPPPNYEESKVPQYTLPDPLILNDGQRVTDAATWREKHRPEVLRLFEQYVYGKGPGKPAHVSVRGSFGRSSGHGRHGHPQRSHHSPSSGRKGPKIDVLLYLPKKARGPSPVFLGLNFGGNHTIHPTPASRPPTCCRRQPAIGQTERRGGCQGPRGGLNRWPIEKIIARGYVRGNGLVRRHRTRHDRRPWYRGAEALFAGWTNRARR